MRRVQAKVQGPARVVPGVASRRRMPEQHRIQCAHFRLPACHGIARCAHNLLEVAAHACTKASRADCHCALARTIDLLAVLKHCPSSCDVCTNETHHSHSAAEDAAEHLATKLASPGACHDVAGKADECKAWVESGECINNPGFMLANCAASCGLCTAVCQDHAAECPVRPAPRAARTRTLVRACGACVRACVRVAAHAPCHC